MTHRGPGPLLTPGTYQNWEAWRIQADPLELVLVPQVGGRVMSMQWRGHDLSFTQPEGQGTVEDVGMVADVHARKRDMGFPLWGGEKTWLAPQGRWTDGVPYLDLDSGAYERHVEQEGPGAVVVRLVSPVCRETGIQITRTIAVQDGVGEWSVTHRLSNTSATDVAWGVWSVAMVLRPGRVYIPQGKNSAHPNGVKTFPEEGQSVRVRDTVVSAVGNLAVITCDSALQFKFGVDAQEDQREHVGWMLGILDVPGVGLVGYQKEVPTYSGQPYGHGCLAEVFNSGEYPYLEMEIHGPVVALGPGEAFELTERQRLFDVATWPQTADAVRELVRR